MSPPLPSSSRHLSEEDRVILVMGLMGVGKSTFINTVTSQDGSTVGHGLTASTFDIKPVAVKGPDGHPLVFVDTPGFDNPNKSDADIWATILSWLAAGHKKPYKLAGIIYLHRIIDPRMNGPAVKNFHAVDRISGRSNVVLVTTFWGQVAPDTGMQREAELKETFWKEMSEKGYDILRFHGGQESALAIINPLLSKKPTQFIPTEMVDDMESPNDELKRLGTEQTNASDRLRKLVNQPNNTKVQAEVEEIERKMFITSIQLHILKSPLVKWLRRLLRQKQ